MYHSIPQSMYNSPIEAELNALNKCGALLSELDANAKIRVLKYLVEMFDLANSLQPNGGNGNSQKHKTNNGASNNLSHKLIDGREQSSSDGIGDEVEIEEVESHLPTIKDIVMRDLPKLENEWVLIYAFYSSEFGKEQFTRENVLEKYAESGRRDTVRIKNLSSNFKACVIKKWFKGVNDTNYLITPEGKKYAEQVIAGKSEGKPKPKNVVKKKPAKAAKE